MTAGKSGDWKMKQKTMVRDLPRKDAEGDTKGAAERAGVVYPPALYAPAGTA